MGIKTRITTAVIGAPGSIGAVPFCLLTNPRELGDGTLDGNFEKDPTPGEYGFTNG
jgi:hypothetical protein